MSPPTRPLINRLLDKVAYEPNTGCWLWLGAVSKETGYGVISAGRRGEGQLKAHRASVLVFRGELGRGQVLHRCNQPLCVNPDHLEVSSQSVNMLYMYANDRGRNQFSEEYQPRWDDEPPF